ncbi:pre-RNA processing PIH1/Nop17-domain-containing protein [Pisolithus albus]|nr:pre-RNA processing PIH1/Nop17-domain-containing protein [Pisolithus albus]
MATAAATKQVAVTLNPVPGFCVKTRATNDTVVHTSIADGVDVSRGTRVNRASQLIPVTKDLKIFVNIAWDSNVPPPPQGSEEAVQRAMRGLHIDESSPDSWFVPLVVSDARRDSDKAGKPAIVFDAVFNPSIKSRASKDADFKYFIIELAFQRIEAQTTIILSRQIGTPNIASKGKLQTRQVVVPSSLYPPSHPKHRVPAKLIQEIQTHPTVDSAPETGSKKQTAPTKVTPNIPSWSWSEENSRLRIEIHVPALTHAAIPLSTLEVEPRRVLLSVPSLYHLDIDLNALDADLTATFAKTGSSMQALTLKRKRDLDVDNAKAEWRVADKTIILQA